MENMAVESVSKKNEGRDKKVYNLEEALSIAGIGLYSLKYCVVSALFLIAIILEIIGYSYVLPAAKCDLNMSDNQRGFISSMPYIVIVFTSFPWGYLVDTRGRKTTVIQSSIAGGFFGILASFMPELYSFTVCKFIASLCMACPAAAPFTYIGEITPKNHRDICLSVTNSVQTLGSTLVPLIAWGILELEFRYDFIYYEFRAWRLLSIIFSSTFIIAAVFMSFGPESPKYLLAKGKHDEALAVLQTMYAKHHNKAPEDYPVHKLIILTENEAKAPSFWASLKEQSLPLLKPPYAKWLALNGFILFGIFATLNGLMMWAPDVVNRVMTGSVEGMSACEVIQQRFNQTSEEAQAVDCDDSIGTMTFIINAAAKFVAAVIGLIASGMLKFVGKKTVLVTMFFILGAFGVSINFTNDAILFSALLTSMQISNLGIGLVNAYAVQIFPTYLRGMAVSLTMMMGRIGSAVGSNVAGLLLNNICEATFYSFGGLLLLCGVLSFLLPSTKRNGK